MQKYWQYIRTNLHVPALPPLKFRSLFTRKRVLIGGGIVLAFLLITPIATYAYYARDINNPTLLMNHNNTGIVLKDRNGQVFYSYGHMGGGDVPLNQISPNIQHALIASEDKDFYHNNGVSLRGLLGAVYGDIISGDPTKYGGSTITQQLVKNKLLTSNKNFLRKYQEIAMAIAVNQHYSKNDILDMYLNSVYFGEGAFGVKDAAKAYFNTTPDKLTIPQSAILVGLLPAPSAYSPLTGNKTLAVQQQHRVLDRMQINGYITAAQKQVAEATPLHYAPADPNQSNDHAQHFAAMIIDQLKQKYGEEYINRSGFEVTTSLDLNSQIQAESIIKNKVAQFTKDGGTNAALVAIDPKTGYVRALVGSVDWNNSQFGQVNMATTPRQPGSSFKPIYYSYALDQHMITAESILQDEPKNFDGWQPHDVEPYFQGNVTVRDALAQSLNIPAIEVMQKVTPQTAAQVAEQMGITTIGNPDKYGLTLAIGTAEVPLYQMTEAYTTFANNGSQMPPVMVTGITDKYGNKVFTYKEPKAKQIRSPQATYVLNSILDDNAARAPLYGTTMNIPGHTVALKTGTTDSNVDAWTIGYTPSLTVGVWVGNNNHQPMGSSLFGGSSAGQIWKATMEAYIGSSPNEAFAMPSGIKQYAACNGVNDYFIDGTQPTCSLPYHIAQQPKKTEDTPAPPTPKPEAQTAGTGPSGDQGNTPAPGTPATGGRGGGDTGGGGTTTTPPSSGTGSGGAGGGTNPGAGSGSGGSDGGGSGSGGGTTQPPSNGSGSGTTQPPSKGGPGTQPTPQNTQ